METKWKF